MNVNYLVEFFTNKDTVKTKVRLPLKGRVKLVTILLLVADVVELVDTPS